MLLPKERIRVPLIFLGISLGVSGLALLIPARMKSDGSYAYAFRKSAYVEAAATGALSSYAPYMVGVAVASLIGAFLLREKQ